MKWNEELKQMREAAGYTIEEAAQEIFCSTEALRSYEAGERFPREEVANRIWELYKGVRIS